MKKGLFITFEGNDGCGKTTISTLVMQELQQQGLSVLYTREPGGIGISEQIRDIILDPANHEMDARTEALLYAASRRQHLVEKIIPALERGTHVICDRFIDSSLAYQGMGREIGMQEVYDMNLFATQGMLPDLTLFLDISLEEAMERVCKRGGKDRLDLESDAFHQRVREGYERVKELYPQRIHVVDAHQSIDEVKEACIREIRMLLKQYEYGRKAQTAAADRLEDTAQLSDFRDVCACISVLRGTGHFQKRDSTVVCPKYFMPASRGWLCLRNMQCLPSCRDAGLCGSLPDRRQ